MRILFKNLLLNKNIMRRRNAPRQMPAPPPQQQQRMPQPSIKSSQIFSPQQGQYPQYPQYQQPQQQNQQMDPRRQSKGNDYVVENGSSPKMSLAQAITLITLRLGSVESKLMNGEIGSSFNSDEGESLEQFNERLNLLEEKINSSSTNNYKQQIDQLAEAIIQSKHLSNSLSKENKELKTELSNLKKQLIDVKNTLLETEQLAKNNENKIFQMLNSEINVQLEDEDEFDINNEEIVEEQSICENKSEQLEQSDFNEFTNSDMNESD
jgi:chromosome segregation ATPase